MKYFIFTLLLFASSAAFAAEWTEADTLNAELNPSIGHHPTVGRVSSYFAVTTAATAAILVLLPRGWREGFEYMSTRFEIGVTAHNRYIGIRSKF